MQHGGLARRIFDEAPGKDVPPEEAAQMLRDYIAPSLDTTISMAAYLAWHFADSPDQWQLIREDKSLIGNANADIEIKYRQKTTNKMFHPALFK